MSQISSISVGPDVTVTRLVVGPMDNNAYLIHHGDHCALIDAAAEADVILAALPKCGLDAIITTHRHHDHLGALATVAEHTQAQCFAGRYDVSAIEEATGVACRPVWTSDQIKVGPYTFGVIGLVGHTPGSIAVVLDLPGSPVHIFTGDSLFPGGVGKTTSREEFETLFRDVTRYLFDHFPDDTVIHPGHGDPTTLSDERPHLEEWKQRGW